MKKLAPLLFITIVVFYLLFLTRTTLFGQLAGTFKPSVVPVEYKNFERNLFSDEPFFRTLWIPRHQRFGYYSNSHPAVSAKEILRASEPLEMALELNNEDIKNIIDHSSIKYIVVPFDSRQDLFIKDRKYDETLYLKTVEAVREVDWLREIGGFGKIAVFENSSYKDHIWSPNSQLIESYEMINPTRYIVNVKNARNGDLIVFSENYDAHWWAIPTDEDKLSNLQKGRLWGSNPYQRFFNSFIVRREGDYSVEIFYLPQRWVEIGSIISLAALVTIVLTLIALSKPHKWLKKLKNAKIRL